jgi:hypothetical protein
MLYRFITKKALFFMAALLFANHINAQTSSENFLSKIKINAFLSGGYEYNFNTPADMKNSYRIFDTDHNSFKMDVVELSLHQDIEKDTPFGFRVDIAAGSSIPKTVRASGLNCGDLDVMQMYVSYVIPIGSGIRIDFGKFFTFLGYEVIENCENFNDNQSRSFSFGYTVPFTHTGVKAFYAFSDKMALTLFAVNGWDNSVDNNKSKSFGAQLAITPESGLSIYANYLTGPEQNDNDRNNRSILDFTGIYSTGKFSFGTGVNFAKEDFSSVINGSSFTPAFTANWNSYTGYIKYNFSNSFSLSLRAELFNDADGVRTGTVQNLSEITITPAYMINDHILIRGDLRFDTSDKATFTSDSSFSKKQTTVSCNIIYHF